LALPIIAYTLSSRKLEIRTKHFCLEARGWGERKGAGEKGGGREKRGEMTQTLYVHMNKRNKKQKDSSQDGILWRDCGKICFQFHSGW
jgi:hypothetical protein